MRMPDDRIPKQVFCGQPAIHSHHRLTRPLELEVTMPGSSRAVRRCSSPA